MTQAPTPGPLSAEDVKLLVKLLDTLKPFAEVAEKLKHCHVVEICEPTPDNPSRNIIPMPREWFERAGDDLEYIAIQLHAAGVLSEGQASKVTGLDRVEVRREVDRLAPTAPVEASGSERDAFEKWYCDDAATVGIKMLPVEILALREGDTYGAKRVALNSKWEAWQARAALDRG